jgi:hypothetical protein
MIYIAHRGLVSGPDPDIENSPELIENTITSHEGVFIECDMWVKNDKWWLGHDAPQYQVSDKWFDTYHPWLFIHAKNQYCVQKLTLQKSSICWFFHDKEAFTWTSKGHLWQFPHNPASQVIINQPELAIKLQTKTEEQIKYDISMLNNKLPFRGVCSKYINILQNVYGDE